MNWLKFLGKCLLDFLDSLSPPSTSECSYIVIGLFEVLILGIVYIIAAQFLVWYYAVLITIAFAASLAVVICLIEFIVHFIEDHMQL